MSIDLTDWAALLEALDGIRGKPPSPPPLPMVIPPFVATHSAHRRAVTRRQPPMTQEIPRSQ